MTIIIAAIMFSGLVFVHELGHLLAAKATGITVNEFSVGMGPLLLSRSMGETDYSIRAFPFGGYCRMEDMEGAGQGEGGSSGSSWAKTLVIVAGSFMNILTTLVLLFGLFTASGIYTTTVAEVPAHLPAYAAGLEAGDRILAVNDRPVKVWNDVVEAITGSAGETVGLQVERDGVSHLLHSAVAVNEEGRRVVGMSPALTRQPAKTLTESVRMTGHMIGAIGGFLRDLLAGRTEPTDVVGAVGIISIIGTQAQYGLGNLLYLMAMISLNLGVVNLLPLPALDGGRLLFIVIRAVSGGRFDQELEAKIHAVGMVFLMGLMVLLIFKDTLQFIL